MRVKWVPIVLLMCGAAFGFIQRLFPLKEILEASTTILVGRVESVDTAKRTAVAVIDRPLKGKREFSHIRMNLGVAPDTHFRYLLRRLRPGQPFIIFYQREKKSLASCVHAGDTWFQLFGTDQADRGKVWWRMSHLEIYLGRTYDGTTADLVKLVGDVLAGRVEAPPPNPAVPKLDPTATEPVAGRSSASPPREEGKDPSLTAAAGEGLEALDGWAVDDSWSRPAKLALRSAQGGAKVIEAACEGEPERKLALVLLHHMDISKAFRFALNVANASGADVKVSVAFGAAPDWQMHETRPVVVPPSKGTRAVSFRLDRGDFKCQDSGWKHTRGLPNEGRIDKTMILVEGLPERGKVSFDGLHLCRGGFSRMFLFPHRGGEVRGIAWADINSDEMLDACVCVGKGNLLLINQGGRFKEQAAALGLKEGSRSASLADYNGDGHPDLLTNNFRLFTNSGGRLRDDSTLLPAPRERNPEGAGWIDYNGDGRPDILITNGEHGIRLYENTGKPPEWFRDVSGRAGLGPRGIGVGNGDFVAFADVDADGCIDFFYNLGDGLLVRNNGRGRFVAEAESGIVLPGRNAKRGICFADFDGDADLDLFVPAPRTPRLYRNNDDGTFTDVIDVAGAVSRAPGQSMSCAWGDVNNDGALDLFVCHTAGGSRLYMGAAGGLFRDATEEVAPGGFPACFAASFADVDADGDLDLLMNTKDAAVLALNDLDIGEDRAALAVDVQAARGLTGAVVRVVDADDRPLGIYGLTGAEGCGGQPSPVAHFGLKRGAEVRVSVGLSDGRLASKSIAATKRVNRLCFLEADFD